MALKNLSFTSLPNSNRNLLKAVVQKQSKDWKNRSC